MNYIKQLLELTYFILDHKWWQNNVTQQNVFNRRRTIKMTFTEGFKLSHFHFPEVVFCLNFWSLDSLQSLIQLGSEGELRGEHLTMLLPYFVFIYCILYTLYHTTVKYNKKDTNLPFQSHITQSISYHTVRANVLCHAVPQETIV